jgi:outer membrane biogenesis lipoprotein LolB
MAQQLVLFQMKIKLNKFLTLLFACLVLCACAENKYRGIPESSWQQLTAEQKQLIIDRSFQNEFKK